MPSAKFDVEMSSFKSGISAAKNEVKTLDQQMKMLDATMKAEGKSEQTLSQQTQTLNNRMTAQKNIAKNAEAALKAMTNEGIDPASDAYQRMSRELLAAQTGMMETQAALNQLGQGAEQAAGGVEQLENGLNGISKKISLEQVRSGIDTISKGLENAAKKAVNLGKAIWENITDVARFSDDTATQAMILNMNVEDYQAYKKVFDTEAEITVQEWQKAKQKVQKAINDPTQEQVDLMKMLGINTHDIVQGKNGEVQGAARDFEEVFWQIGDRLREKVASGEMTQDLADTYANAIFGKGFAQLNPIFDMGQDTFMQKVNEQKVASEEAIKKNAELNDKLIRLQGDFESLKAEALSGLAPALTGAAEALDGLLTSVLDYLQKPEGQKALEDLGTAVSGLFSDLGKIDPEKVVEGFTGVFNTVIDSVQWLVENKDGVISALEAIVIGWGALQLTGGALQILKLIEGLQGLGIIGGKKTGTTGGGTPSGGESKRRMSSLLSGMGAVFMFDDLDPLEQHTIATNASKGKTGREAVEAWQSALLENGSITKDMFDRNMKVYDMLELTVKPVPREDAEKEMQEQIGVVDIPAQLVVVGISDGTGGGGHGGGGGGNVMTYDKGFGGILLKTGFHANGIWSVPTDNYLALLHKDERVVPARAVNNRNFTSNMYIENMTMNNGQDADGLAARVAAENRRIMSGYGSN